VIFSSFVPSSAEIATSNVLVKILTSTLHSVTLISLKKEQQLTISRRFQFFSL